MMGHLVKAHRLAISGGMRRIEAGKGGERESEGLEADLGHAFTGRRAALPLAGGLAGHPG